MINSKHILILDLVVVIGSLFVIAGFVGYSQPLVISPIDDFETTDTSVLFGFDNGEAILIDDNLEFTSPLIIYAEDNMVINLKPGTYYWKVEGVIDSEIRSLTIVSEIDLKLRESGTEGKYEIVNAGNTVLNVEIYRGENLEDEVVLGVDESKEVSGTKFVGGQEDE
jgi:hypothetical protein